MKSEVWRWILGLTYIVLVAAIWIAACFVVQSAVDEGVSPFLITYICNSLFIVYIPLFEIGRYLEDTYGGLCFWRYKESKSLEERESAERVILLEEGISKRVSSLSVVSEAAEVVRREEDVGLDTEVGFGEQRKGISSDIVVIGDTDKQLDSKGRWTRRRVAKVRFPWLPLSITLSAMPPIYSITLEPQQSQLDFWASTFLPIFSADPKTILS